MLRIPKGYNTITKTFNLPEDMVHKMEKLAKDHMISLNRLVIHCLQYAMDNLEESVPDKPPQEIG